MPASNVSLGLWLHRYCFAITVTKLTSASVLPEARRQLQAHAWVESQGRIVSGGLRDLWRYPTPIAGGKDERSLAST